jgi:hypothetical protein
MSHAVLSFAMRYVMHAHMTQGALDLSPRRPRLRGLLTALHAYRRTLLEWHYAS